ncbi:arylsulfatase [Natronoarchaeum philippinense]|uniref:Arylsulfatase n=1 Tax=Natronoarchaeum philippinense TaxID=558529 RepID=A0A285P696_NATPI|nr:sulfatase-like hydrolase/transferase [Natronoarchaeum philippinense]SNZ15401.1 arylsulfatase [Natronoarchaeum philippinense]
MTNVAVVVLDTLRYDYFEDYFGWLDGTRFTTAYSTSHWTIPAHASLFTGLYPSEAGTHAKSPSLECDTTVLAEHLRQEGYKTRFFTGNGNITAWPGWERGFDHFVKPRDLDPQFENSVDWDAFDQRINASGLSRYLHGLWYCVTADSPTFRSLKHGYRRFKKSNADGGGEAILDRLQKTNFQNNGEFLAVNIMETHTPYYPPSNEANPIRVSIGQAFAENVTEPAKVCSAYEQSVIYLSSVYERIYEQLNKDFDYVITLGDHGEMLGEHGLWNHGYGLYPELTQIPLVISGSEIPDTTRSEPVSILDVHATIGSLTGIDVGGRGQNLLDDDFQPRHRLVEYHGFMNSHREQFKREGAALETFDKRDSPLYGMVTPDGRYGYQDHDAGVQFVGESISSFEETLHEKRKYLDEVDNTAVEPDETVKSRLKDLGYA